MIKSTVLGLLVFAMTGCVVSAGDPAGDRAPGTGEPRAKPNAVPEPMISGTVTSSSAARDTLAGSEVCLWNLTAVQCTQTDSAGWYELASAPENRITALFEKAGHQRARIDVTDAHGPLFAHVLLIPDADAAEFAQVAGRQHDPATTGGIVVATHAIGYTGVMPLADVAVELHGADGNGVVYADEAGHPDTSLAVTSLAGWAAAIGIAPSKLSIEVHPTEPGLVCTTFWDGTRGLGRPIEAQVEAGYVTMVLVACVPEALVAH